MKIKVDKEEYEKLLKRVEDLEWQKEHLIDFEVKITKQLEDYVENYVENYF